MVDGRHVLALASSQDHKRLQDGDRGPNTGGMGAYSPAPVVTPALHARLMREVILPTVAGMAADGIRYTGFLYAGVMIDAAGTPRVLEFNCRLGDPETQPILARLRSDLVDLLQHAVNGTLDRAEAEWDRRAALGVVLAAHGYPEAPRKGDVVTGLDRLTAERHPDVVAFHAGTALQGDEVVTSGGRVLCVTALGESVRLAQKAAYAAIADVSFAGMQFRSDIGFRAVGRK
jgi:phosphoribosylamine--glycine ligase